MCGALCVVTGPELQGESVPGVLVEPEREDHRQALGRSFLHNLSPGNDQCFHQKTERKDRFLDEGYCESDRFGMD